MKFYHLFFLFSVAIPFLSCGKQDLTLSVPPVANAHLGGGVVSKAILTGGVEVNNLEELHAYVKTYGFNDAVNGVPFRIVNGVLIKGMSPLAIRLNGLLPDQTPVVDRKNSFMLKVMAQAEAYAWSLYDPTTPGMLELVNHLRNIQKDNFSWFTNGNAFDNFGLPGDGSLSGTTPSKNSDGFYPWEVAHRQFLNNLFQHYLTSGTPNMDISGVKYIEAFRTLLLQVYVPDPFSVGEALPWAMNGTLGASLDAYYFNIYNKGRGAGGIADILYNQNNQRAGVMVNIMSQISGERVYMYIGNTIQAGTVAFHWNSSNPSNSYNPWALTPDFTALLPVAGGPPVINPGNPDL